MTLAGKRRRWRLRVAACGLLALLALLAILAQVALMLAGCGGDSSASSSSRSPAARRAAAYRSNANALCEAMRDRLRHLGQAPRAGPGPPARRLSSAGRYFRGRESDISRTIAKLSALGPPPGDRPAINRLLGTMRATDQLERNQFRSALRGYRPGFLRASAALRPSLGAEGKAARAAHLRACALGSSR